MDAEEKKSPRYLVFLNSL